MERSVANLARELRNIMNGLRYSTDQMEESIVKARAKLNLVRQRADQLEVTLTRLDARNMVTSGMVQRLEGFVAYLDRLVALES